MPIMKLNERMNECSGIVESTGMTAQMRTSYLPSEILWGHRLAPLLAYQTDNGQYRIDYKRFHAVESITMPDCSAKTLADTETGHRGDKDDVDTEELTSVTLMSAGRPSSRSRKNSLASGGSVIRRVRGSLKLRRHSTRPARRYSEHVIVIDGEQNAKPANDIHRLQNSTERLN